MSPAAAPSTEFAAALLSAFARAGVRDVVVAPGSRSQALALAAAGLDRVGAIRLRVRIDERSAAFLALGLARESGAPAIVITTSGTAVANLHPAVLEAHHAGVPLIVLSADRPEELRGVGANQTTTHAGMFGEAARRTWDVGAPTGEPGEAEAAAGIAEEVAAFAMRALGPVHLNVAFTEPLAGPWEPPVGALRLGPADLAQGSSGSLSERSESKGLRLTPGPRTVVIAGAGAGPRAEEVARELGAVLFAEVVSGAHFGPNLVVPYREVIRDEGFLGAVERIVVFGRPTLSREVPWLVERGGAETIVVRSPGADDWNPGRSAGAFADAVVVDGDPDRAAERAWVGPWVAASRRWLDDTEDVAPEVFAGAREKARHELGAVRQPVTRRALVEAVWRASWPQDRLVVASSRLVRVLDRHAVGKAIPVHANRGLAGIDGLVSTAVGVALGSQYGDPSTPAGRSGGRAGTTRLLTGDLAFLHDVGGLAFGVGEARPRVMVVVGNDGGGTIFDDLEVASLAGPDFDRVMLTPQTASIEGLARAYGWEHRRVETRGELDPALGSCTGPTVVEVPLPR
ncbi:MAG: 2-succinyl-5-enolpyruvyl-6-hydroxy-3-cyclohexene-1-carboxylic-acid synthase [Microbacteriaceae bacterium]|nr:2-succinyl-5-enolpyruvyl-6-hydroxy-3-cyclohexene-1-carboxylic-acid synthase [Microbacteriaceae bacterium]